MKRKTIIKITFFILIFTVVSLTAACNSKTTVHQRPTTEESKTSASDTKTLAVIYNVDTVSRNIKFTEPNTCEENLFSYDPATECLSKSGEIIALNQIKPGDVVDLYYNPNSHVVNKIQISKDKDVWENKKVTNFKIDETTHSFTIGSSLYAYSDDIVVMSQDEPVSIMELNKMDQLTVRGYGNKVISVTVDKGHGYVSLSGISLFYGGFVEIGGIVVKVIEPDMLITITEGTYKIEVNNGKYSAEKTITVVRDNKTDANFSDVVAQGTETGNIKFNVDNTLAKLYIDGIETDYSTIITLTVGRHKILVTADGYSDYTGTIDVSTGYKVIDVTLNGSENDKNTTTAHENETTTVEGETVISAKNKVTVSGPQGASIYFDSQYKGTAPVTFPMITGTHTITVLNNMKISTYTVNLAEGGDDVTYDFTDK